MKYVINLLILGLIALFAFLLVSGIQEPIKFRTEQTKRKNAVVAKLEKIRKAQEIYREIKGDFAGSFDVLASTLKTDSIPFIRLEEDPEDPTNEDKFIRIVTYSAAIDTLVGMGINLDDLKNVPYSDNASFEMQSDTTTYQSTLVPVMQCMTRYKDFMGVFADAKYAQYDDTYDPNNSIGFGSMTAPNLEGNWK